LRTYFVFFKNGTAKVRKLSGKKYPGESFCDLRVISIARKIFFPKNRVDLSETFGLTGGLLNGSLPVTYNSTIYPQVIHKGPKNTKNALFEL
jgi:hypothetical protein